MKANLSHARRTPPGSDAASKRTGQPDEPQCPAPGVDATLPKTSPLAVAVSGDINKKETAQAASKHSVAPPSPGATPSHTICKWCNHVLTGDPLTVAKPGALVETSGICPKCQNRELETLFESKAVRANSSLDALALHLEREQAKLEQSFAKTFAKTANAFTHRKP